MEEVLQQNIGHLQEACAGGAAGWEAYLKMNA
jgi:hypothetical protein